MTLQNRVRKLEEERGGAAGMTWKDFVTGRRQPHPREWEIFLSQRNQINDAAEQHPTPDNLRLRRITELLEKAADDEPEKTD